jgi:hypothetical protein
MTHTEHKNGDIWLDIDGEPIQAHGGGMLLHQGVYYWYGENKDSENAVGAEGALLDRVDVIGVSCYSSTDLLNWKNEGVVLPAVSDNPEHDLHPSKVAERPKVIFNAKTGKFVLWLHIDTGDYKYARTGVAVSDSPTGIFTYQRSFQPLGADSRDMTVYQDDDGVAYLLHSSDWNATLHIARLSDDYLNVTGESVRAFEKGYREAPAIFKRNGRYYLISSGCTGWNPNPAQVAVAESVMGEWRVQGDPCEGEGAELTFRTQSTFVIPGKDGKFVLMTDRWRPKDLRQSGYAWLPIDWDGDRLILRWRDTWSGL